VYREDILLHAYDLARANDGASGVDEESFEDIESRRREKWLNAAVASVPTPKFGERKLAAARSSMRHEEVPVCAPCYV
jgi:hypothetical protein